MQPEAREPGKDLLLDGLGIRTDSTPVLIVLIDPQLVREVGLDPKPMTKQPPGVFPLIRVPLLALDPPGFPGANQSLQSDH